MGRLTVSAPGKVILHGEHAVVYGKKALAASLDLRTYLILTQRADNLIDLHLPDIEIRLSLQRDIYSKGNDIKNDITKPIPASDEIIETLTKSSGLDADASRSQVLAVASFLYLFTEISRASKCPLPAIDVRVQSELPIGAGLGSSASYSVCLAAGLLQLGNHIHQSKPSSNTEGYQLDQSSWSHDETELINKWAFLSEKIMHGNPSGVDNSVTTFGGAIEFKKGKIDKLSQMPETRILLVNTKVQRNTKTLMAHVRTKYEKFGAVIGPVMEAIDAVTTRSIDTYCNLLNNDLPSSSLYKELEELIDINQCLLRTLGVSQPKLEQVCEITGASGLHAKLTGAGGGGCAFCLLRPGTPKAVVREVMSQLKSEGFGCWETNICGQGVIRHWTHSENYNIPSGFLPE
ncbi:mevalonate kinase-like isoform X2 [Ylistrum balloti]|uniref:mevalonate kinase-like isoform X2 n=1 Tax=Ylistrum balloti TaxID=509963 RepID=UPI0029058716|nr:mevalonate kinase-like isoform X2 [Ylistrum balloti]